MYLQRLTLVPDPVQHVSGTLFWDTEMGQELAKELQRWRTAFYKVFFGEKRVVSDVVVSLAWSLCLKHRAGLCFAGQLSSKTQNLPAASPIPVH